MINKEQLESDLASAPAFRPSGLNALSKCFWFEGDADDTDAEDSEEANQGQIEHDVMRRMLTELNETNKLTPDNYDIEPDAFERCVWGVSQVVADESNENPKTYTECKLQIVKGFTPIMHGTSDVVIVDDTDTVKVKDYKTGGIERDCRPQLIFYGLAAMLKHKKKYAELEVIYTRMRKVVKYVIDIEAATGVLETIFVGYFNRDEHEPHLNEYCAFCAIKNTCPLMTSIVNAIVEKRDDWELPGYHHENYLATAESRGKAIMLARLMAGWSEGALYHVKSAMMRGDIAEGYKIQTQRGRASIPDIVALFSMLEMSGKDFINACSISITALVNAIYDNDVEGKYKSKAACKREIDKMLEENQLIERGEEIHKIVKD